MPIKRKKPKASTPVSSTRQVWRQSTEAKITIALDGKLLREIEASLSTRGTNIQTYIRLQLRAFRRGKMLLGLDDQMTFGKFAGERVEDICRAETGYMNWIVSESTTAKFDHTVLALLEELAP